MTRSFGETEAPGTRVAVASAERLQELAAALTALRAQREVALIGQFLLHYEADHRQAERDQALCVPRREAQDRLLDVRDLLGTRMPRVAVRRDADHVIVRELGWRLLERELSRAFSFVRVGAPDEIVRRQKKAVREALLAMGWDEGHAPPVKASLDLAFWTLPVRSGAAGVTIGELDAEASAQQAWEHAQRLVERGLELCRPPLQRPTPLGEGLRLSLPGATPLIASDAPAAPGWVEPSWSPSFAVVADAAALRHAVSGGPAERVADARSVLGDLFTVAHARAGALVWWVEA